MNNIPDELTKLIKKNNKVDMPLTKKEIVVPERKRMRSPKRKLWATKDERAQFRTDYNKLAKSRFIGFPREHTSGEHISIRDSERGKLLRYIREFSCIIKLDITRILNASPETISNYENQRFVARENVHKCYCAICNFPYDAFEPIVTELIRAGNGKLRLPTLPPTLSASEVILVNTFIHYLNHRRSLRVWFIRPT